MARTISPARTEVYLVLLVAAMNLAFLAVVAAVCWMLGLGAVGGRLAIAFAALWAGTLISTELMRLWEHVSGITADSHYRTYVGTNLAVCIALASTWGIYSGGMLAASSVGIVVLILMYIIGFLASYMAFGAVTAIFDGSIYKIVLFPLVFVVFTVSFVAWTIFG